MANQKPSLQNVFKMLLSTNTNNVPVGHESDLADDVDEPPDLHLIIPDETPIPPSTDAKTYIKSLPAWERKESLLTRALMSSPDPLSRDPKAKQAHHNVQLGNISSVSTAELTSDGGLTSPPLSNTPSPPSPSELIGIGHRVVSTGTTTDATESVVEANLGRKRCISFACARKVDRAAGKSIPAATTTVTVNRQPDSTETPKRKCALTFACPTRQSELAKAPSATAQKPSSRPRPRGSPAPIARKSSGNPSAPNQSRIRATSIHMTGLGDINPSEETSFHEFASSQDEVDEWVAQPAEYKEKITLNDCMKKENVIRKLGEEAEAEAMEEEQAEDEADAEEDLEESTIHDFSSDDGNESDNEAGFADSDDSDDGSEYEFWAPSTTTAATSTENFDLIRQAAERRNSNTSIESLNHAEGQTGRPSLAHKGSQGRGIRIPEMHPGTPDLPDSTDFVCGTLDEDRPLEAAYMSCLEERRRSKHVPIPQDIDPSFPTTDPEDNDNEADEEDEIGSQVLADDAIRPDEESRRGRSQAHYSRKASPRMSPKRVHSPAPRVHGQHSPKRMKSPAPVTRQLSTTTVLPDKGHGRVDGLVFRNPVQRPPFIRTKSLPRTPNPFFIGLEKARQENDAMSRAESPVAERGVSRSRDIHTRGPIDIIQGLERKRQKRKEKYWRNHNRKLGKDQMERRPLPGRGAERMKELGLEVAERFRAYGTGQDAQLVLSV